MRFTVLNRINLRFRNNGLPPTIGDASRRRMVGSEATGKHLGQGRAAHAVKLCPTSL